MPKDVVITKDVDISDYAKEILDEVFKNNSERKEIVDKCIKFVSVIINKEKIEQYTNYVKKIIEIEKGDGPEYIEALKILDCIKDIIKDLFAHLEEIKESSLTKNDRKFIRDNIDVVIQVVIVSALDGIEDKSFVNKEALVKILSVVELLSFLEIDMKIRNLFSCCKK